MMGKKWYHSRTLWIMGIALIASIIAGITGEDWLDGELQVAILSFVGLILRIITGDGLTK